MGYTHYWTSTRAATPEEWALVCRAARIIIRLAAKVRVPLAWEYDEPRKPPQVDGEDIRFNGVEEDGHETFLFSRDRADATFCKTAKKPYDLAVTAILIAADTLAPGVWEISSDGTPEDWAPGLGLAVLAGVSDARIPADVLQDIFT